MLSWSCAEATRARGDRDARCFMGKTLLVVGTGAPKRGPVFDRLRSLGLARVVCLNATRNWAAPYVTDWILADPTDLEGGAVAAVLAAHASSELGPIDGVVTFDEFSVQLAAELAQALGLTGGETEVAARVRNKLAFRQFCTDRGLPTPRYAGLPAGVEAGLVAVEAAGLCFPLIFKPVYGGGSTLVRKVCDPAELASAIAAYEASSYRSPTSLGSRHRGALVEEYLEGAEVDIDMLVQGGLVRYCEVTDNFSTSEPYFLETGGCFPSQLPKEVQLALKALATQVVTALALQDGCVHFEARVTASGPVPIELNLRLGGAEVLVFHRAARGLDLAAEAVKIALGAPVARPMAPVSRCCLASTNFVPTATGRLAQIEIDPAVWQAAALVEIVVFGEVGRWVARPPEAYEYLGWLVGAGSTPLEAREQTQRLARGVCFRFDSLR